MFTFKTNDQAQLLSLCKTAAKNDTRDLSGLDIMRDCFFFLSLKNSHQQTTVYHFSQNIKKQAIKSWPTGRQVAILFSVITAAVPVKVCQTLPQITKVKVISETAQ